MLLAALLVSVMLTIAQPAAPAAAEVCIMHNGELGPDWLSSPCSLWINEDEVVPLVQGVVDDWGPWAQALVDQCMASTCAQTVATAEYLVAMAVGIVAPLPAWCLDVCVATVSDLAGWAVDTSNGLCESATSMDCASYAVWLTLKLVNEIVLPAVQTAPEAAAQLAADILTLANSSIDQARSQVGPTYDAVMAQVWDTVDAVLPLLGYVVSLVPAPAELVALATELANLVVGFVPPTPAPATLIDTLSGLAGSVTGPQEADGENNTGVRGDPPGTNPAGEGDVLAAFDKLFVAQQMEADVVAALAANSTPTTEDWEMAPGRCYYRPFVTWTTAAPDPGTIGTSSQSPCPADVVPGNSTVPREPAPPKEDFKAKTLSDQQVFVQERTYTCGPSAGRALLEQMTGVLFSEPTMAAEMGTTTQGTDNPSWARVVNAHQTKDTFRVDQATSPEQLMARVIYDVSGQAQPAHRAGEANASHSMGLNVNHTVLSYWNRAKRVDAGHFVLASGYSTRGGGMIRLSGGGDARVLGHHEVALERVWESQTEHFLGGRTVW